MNLPSPRALTQSPAATRVNKNFILRSVLRMLTRCSGAGGCGLFITTYETHVTSAVDKMAALRGLKAIFGRSVSFVLA